jgi:hypothetical protein
MVEVPSKTGVINPVDAFTVATPVDNDCQVPPELPLVVNVTEPLEQIDCVPLNVPAFGAVVTVTVLLAEALAHAPVPVTVYVMVAVPAATPVTTPVLLFTVATAILFDDQVPPTSPFLVNVTEPLEQIACVPLTVPAFGATVTVTVLVAVASAHPPVPVTV